MENTNELIKMTNEGFYFATFPEIRAAIIERYKAAYGSDIDLSTGCADGVFVNDLALLMNNILEAVKSMYNSMDVNVASGTYLDRLCSLANITRKPATKSIAYITMKNISSSSITLEAGNEFVFSDKSAMIWIATIDQTTTVESQSEIVVKAVCSASGAVSAPTGWINQSIELDNKWSITQKDAAIIGREQETDSELRYRRSQTNGGTGVTVLESLAGALLNVSGIDDVKIINNNTGSNKLVPDGIQVTGEAVYNTTITPHNIYIVLRYSKNITILDETIGQIIYDRLTPGIATTQSNVTQDVSHSLTIQDSTTQISDFNNTVYWKEAKGSNFKFTFTITPNDYFVESEVQQIVSTIATQINALPIDYQLSANDILVMVANADVTFNGIRTYIVDSATAPNTVTNLKYYDYDSSSFSIDKSTGKYVVTVGK